MFLFSPLFEEDFQFDEHMFQMGWFNHHLVVLLEKKITVFMFHFHEGNMKS